MYGALQFPSLTLAQEGNCSSAVLNMPDGYEANDLILVHWEKCVERYEYDEVVTAQRFSAWATNQAYACGMYPSGSISPPPPHVRIWSREWNWCVEIEGNASYQPKIQLGAGLLGVLGFQIGADWGVGLGSSFQRCETSGYTVQYAPAISQCWHTHARVRFEEFTARGRVTEIESIFYWQIEDFPEWPIIEVECGRKVSHGKANKRAGDIIQHAPKTPDCDVMPGPAVMDEDPWEGRRATPCCEPLPGCHETAEPCCGVYSMP
jgi:hypothetical protein